MHPYDHYPPEEFLLRDWLAIDRTVLANERTFLAWVRTALGLVLGGVTVGKLFAADAALLVLAGVSVILGVAAGIAGTSRYLRYRARYASLGRSKPPSP